MSPYALLQGVELRIDPICPKGAPMWNPVSKRPILLFHDRDDQQVFLDTLRENGLRDIVEPSVTPVAP